MYEWICKGIVSLALQSGVKHVLFIVNNCREQDLFYREFCNYLRKNNLFSDLVLCHSRPETLIRFDTGSSIRILKDRDNDYRGMHGDVAVLWNNDKPINELLSVVIQSNDGRIIRYKEDMCEL